VIDHTYSVGRPDKLVFFSVGDEINAGTIYRTDTGHPDVKDFTGNYIHLSNRTPSEVAIARLMDAAITYEYGKYGIKHLYCHTSWTHIGPVANRSDLEVAPSSVFFADFGDIICMNIYTYARGVVTSPPGSVTGTTYQGYIEDLIKISQKPVIITQVGLSTSPIAPIQLYLTMAATAMTGWPVFTPKYGQTLKPHVVQMLSTASHGLNLWMNGGRAMRQMTDLLMIVMIRKNGLVRTV
jgi:hypothetical protein